MRLPGGLKDALAVGVLLLAANGCGRSPGEPEASRTSPAVPDRPNIVIILSDDTTFRDLGCYGSEQVKTPHIDRLASQGALFTNCYTGTAMCSPARQQLYTGIFPVRNGAFANHSHVKDGTRSIVHHLEALGYRVGLHGKKHVGPEASFPFEIVEDLEGFIQPQGNPFCLIVASQHSHAPWNDGPQGAYDPARVTVPPDLIDTPEMRRALARYHAEITALDDQVSEYLTLIDESGLSDDTLLVFTSEQGAGMPFAKWTCYDSGLKTALIVRWPGRVRAGLRTDALVQYVDVLPTLLEAVGADPVSTDTGLSGDPEGGRGFDGRSFLDVLQGRATTHRDHVFGVQTTRGIRHGSDYPIRSISDGDYKLILNLNPDGHFSNIVQARDPHDYWASWVEKAESDAHAAARVRHYRRRPAEELYDLKADPYELDNLASDPRHRERIAALRGALVRWMTSQGDEGMATELSVTPQYPQEGETASESM